MYDLVLARYAESVDWARTYPPAGYRVLVYDMSADPLPGHINTPNAGQEPGAYLTHIMDNYNKLADVTVFTQAHLFDHCCITRSLADELRTLLTAPPIAYKPLSEIVECCMWEQMVPRLRDPKLHPPSPLLKYGEAPLIAAAAYLGLKCPEKFKYAHGAIFAVPKAAILQHPFEFYLKVYQWAAHSAKTLEAGLLERLWAVIFSRNDHA